MACSRKNCWYVRFKIHVRVMKKLIAIIVILAVALVMALTVPDKKKHKETMMKAIN